MKCCLCGKDAGEYGNNAYPVKDGKCCDKCNDVTVIPTRLHNMKIYLLHEDLAEENKKYKEMENK